MESFETYYNESVIEEISFQGLKDVVGSGVNKAVDATKGAVGATKDAVTDASGKAQEIAGGATEKMAELSTSLGEISEKVTTLPQALAEMGQWTVNAGLAGVGGAFVSQGLGTAMTMIANRLDKERLELIKRKQGNQDILVQTEFEKVLEKGGELSEDKHKELIDQISAKWAEKYKIPEPQLFVAAIRKIAEGLKSKFGLVFGAVLAILAFKTGVPFPTF